MPFFYRSQRVVVMLAAAAGAVACNETDHHESTARDSGPKADAPSSSMSDAAQQPVHDASLRDAGLQAADASRESSDANAQQSGDAGLSNYGTDYAAWKASVDKLRNCGIVSEGEFPFDPTSDLRCESLCMLAASCADLKTELCETDAVQSIEDCFDECDDEVVTCGDGTKASPDVVCDLSPDCGNGEDEKHCDMFSCKTGGMKISSYYLCDGEDDCDDGSDELGCATVCGQPRVINSSLSQAR
jgi:hypothetical protein